MTVVRNINQEFQVVYEVLDGNNSLWVIASSPRPLFVQLATRSNTVEEIR